MKKLIINADDFWMSKVYNKEIINLIDNEKISSVSVMTEKWIENQKDNILAIQEVCKWKNISIWIHLEFKWKNDDYLDIIKIQIEKFKNIFWFLPNHIDVHKEAPDELSTKQIVKIANLLKIPFRNRSDQVLSKKHTDWERYIASKKTKKEIDEWIWKLEDNKSYEIVFHPWKYDYESSSSLNKEREDDIKMIIYINEIVENMWIEIISFKDL